MCQRHLHGPLRDLIGNRRPRRPRSRPHPHRPRDAPHCIRRRLERHPRRRSLHALRRPRLPHATRTDRPHLHAGPWRHRRCRPAAPRRRRLPVLRRHPDHRHRRSARSRQHRRPAPHSPHLLLGHRPSARHPALLPRPPRGRWPLDWSSHRADWSRRRPARSLAPSNKFLAICYLAENPAPTPKSAGADQNSALCFQDFAH